MIARKIELKDLQQVFNLLNELYDNKIEYPIFDEKYKHCLNDELFYGIVA